MRACAAMGVVLTHVAFQTANSSGWYGRLFTRFDLAVAVFFALSGFLLWRGHAAAARGLRHRPPTGHYLRSRIVRIMPGYLVAVVVILALLPDAHADLTVWLANLTLTQVYVPLTLTAGLTQMWSLAVEVSFYLVLPLLALLARRLPVDWRVPAIAALAVAAIAGVAFVIAATPLAGNIGLAPGAVSQVVVKTAMGAVVAGALLAPLVLDAPGTPHRILGSTTMVTLGRWSYGLFIWHLAALAMVFPVIGEFPFNGHMPIVLILTWVFGFAIAAVSYGLIESPCRELLRRWESRHAPSPRDSAITEAPEPAAVG
ncbi:acyltransferase family protein [Mycolicibacterium mucogenicum]|uniref:acyltransferase family protein n=1 Tax=Mycolicibacterium mucogenicum TaxID=56689 RepID=UPI00076A8474|nr:acyltransferase [Mycolicibacterium mucogenicum]